MTILKSTDYCDLHKQGITENGNSVYAIEEITVKAKGTKEIRFAYYKKDANGNKKFVPRPLDLEKEHLKSLLIEGVNEGVISKELLKEVIDSIDE